MQLRADIQVQAAIKALTDTVAPAIDADNKLAVEQLHMVIGALNVVAENLPYQFRFDCDELGRLVELARAIDNMPHDGVTTGIGQAADTGAAVLARAKADPAEVLKSLRALRVECGTATTALVRHGSADVRKFRHRRRSGLFESADAARSVLVTEHGVRFAGRGHSTDRAVVSSRRRLRLGRWGRQKPRELEDANHCQLAPAVCDTGARRAPIDVRNDDLVLR